MTTVWCFQCGTEYVEDVLECVECGVPTTSDKPAEAQDVGSDSEEQLAYDLHEWSGQGRRVLDGLLTTSGVSHAWQGATVIVREADEEQVDELIRGAEIAAMPTLDSEKETMVYELAEYNDELRTRLTELLGGEAIPHEFDAEGDLVVHEEDEDAVDEVFDKLEAPPEVTYEFGDGIDGVDAHDVLSALFLAVTRLRKNAGDARNVSEFGRNVDTAEQLALPFGFNGADWRALLDENIELREALTGDENLELDEIEVLIERSWSRLRPLV